MFGELWSKNLTTKSWVRIPALYTGWAFFTLICCKNCNVCLKRRWLTKKRPGLDHIWKKLDHCDVEAVVQSQRQTLSRCSSLRATFCSKVCLSWIFWKVAKEEEVKEEEGVVELFLQSLSMNNFFEGNSGNKKISSLFLSRRYFYSVKEQVIRRLKVPNNLELVNRM